jgi:hypothetical protein
MTSSAKPLGSVTIPAEWPADDALMSRGALAELLGVSKDAIRGWERRGHGPPKVAAGVWGQWDPVYYRVGDVREWFDRMVRPVSAPVAPEPVEPLADPGKAERRAAALRRVQELLAAEAKEEPVTSIYYVGDDDDFEPFSTGQATQRRGPSGYFSG